MHNNTKINLLYQSIYTGLWLYWTLDNHARALNQLSSFVFSAMKCIGRTHIILNCEFPKW